MVLWARYPASFDNSNIHGAYYLFCRSVASIKEYGKMESSEQESVLNEPVPKTVVKIDLNGSVKDTTVENTSDEGPSAGGILSKSMEPRDEHTSDTHAKDKEGEGGAVEMEGTITEVSEAEQDAPRCTSTDLHLLC